MIDLTLAMEILKEVMQKFINSIAMYISKVTRQLRIIIMEIFNGNSLKDLKYDG